LAAGTSNRQNGMDGGSRLRANARGSLMPGLTDIFSRDRSTLIREDFSDHFLFPNDSRFPGVFETGLRQEAPRLALEPPPPTPPLLDPLPGSLDFHLENPDAVAPFQPPLRADNNAVAAAGAGSGAGAAARVAPVATLTGRAARLAAATLPGTGVLSPAPAAVTAGAAPAAALPAGSTVRASLPAPTRSVEVLAVVSMWGNYNPCFYF
jgi:hypothetical protein